MDKALGSGERPPLIKKIQTDGGRYVYDAATNKILEIDEAIFNYLSDSEPWSQRDAKITPQSERRILQEIEEASNRWGCFSTEYPRIVTFPDEELETQLDYNLQKGPDLLTLNITEKCNLRCKYCTFSGLYFHNRTHSNRSMPLNTALKAVAWFLGFPKEEFHIAYYGGEPFLAFDHLKKVVKYARERVQERAFFNLTTNATRLNDEAISFCVENDIRLMISLDGPQEIHDRYRVTKTGQGSFRKVWQTILKLRNNYGDFFQKNVSFNMVMAPPYDILAVNQFINENPEVFQEKAILLSTPSSNPSELFEKLGLKEGEGEKYRAQKQDLSRVYQYDLATQGQSNPFLDTLCGRALILIHKRDTCRLPDSSPSHGQCLPGDRKCFVDTDGRFYMCERVQARPIGSVEHGLDGMVIRKFLREYSEFLKERCYGCWAIRLCSKCFNDLREGDLISERRFLIHCQAMKRSIFESLKLYCAIREADDGAMAWADHAVIT